MTCSGSKHRVKPVINSIRGESNATTIEDRNFGQIDQDKLLVDLSLIY